jgi:GR25 family glycosyltransferase involved in LPS biosynthesis/predicted O-methyltransferase YrrM
MDNKVKNFIDYPTDINGLELIKSFRDMKKYNTSTIIGKFLITLYPGNIKLISGTALSAFLAGKYRYSYNLFTELGTCRSLSENEIKQIRNNRNKSLKYILDDYIGYPKNIVDKIVSKPVRKIPLVTFTITTCKRFDLFEKTINSFLKCCTDVNRIDKWLCVDDNSSKKDREKMERLYPFFTFYWKSFSEKGHPKSMNIIRDIVKTPFIFHMEDDWKYFHTDNYIGKCIDIMSANKMIGQCLINKNYSELIEPEIFGGNLKTTKRGNRFYIHEYTHDENSEREFIERHGNVRNCAYWPHFSFRPSLLRREVLTTIGPYDENASHFEMDYSYKYVNKGFKSVFLDGIFCMHIGRLTSERNNKNIPNAYDLNNEAQFNGKKEKHRFSLDGVKTYLINLNHRQDRLEEFNKNSTIRYTKFSAINGKNLKPNEQLQRIFEGNDYNMRNGIVGCAMSHIKLFIELLESDEEIFCILEDDITFGPKFEEQIKHILENTKTEEWDLIYLGHHLYPQFQKDVCYDKEIMPKLLKMSYQQSRERSMGGTFAYLITKDGIRKLLDFINTNGMTNGIDTIQQKAINVMNTYYCYPHIVFSECILPGKTTDSDIQYDYTSAGMDNYKDSGNYPERLKKNGVYNVIDATVCKQERQFQYTNEWFCRNINISMKMLKNLFYNNPVNILEIGTHEGRSVIWMLENLCTLPGSTFTSIDPYLDCDTTSPVNEDVYKRFCHNINLCTEKEKFNQYIDYSNNILPKLIQENKIYNLVYIDGSHLEDDVYDDMCNAHQLIESGGIMLMDDAGFDYNKTTGIIGAIKRFLNKNASEYKIILKEWQFMIQKR